MGLSASQTLRLTPGLGWLAKLKKSSINPALPAAIMLAFVVLAIFAPYVAPFEPTKMSLPEKLLPPSFAGGASSHLLGTDHMGRDILSRIIFGAQVSLSISALSILIAACVGTALGLIAAYYRGWVDALLMRIVDVGLSLPLILIAIVLAVTIGSNFGNLVVLVAMLLWPRFARQVRGEALAVMQQEFIALARVGGCSPARIMVEHVFPNVVPTLIVLSTLNLSFVVLLEASLSFLGVGLPPPTPSWGSMINDGRALIAGFPWLSLFPGLAITLVVLSLNFLGDWIRDWLDPKLRQV